MTKQRQRRHSSPPWWEDLPDDELLELRFCDLGLGIEGTPLAQRVAALYEQLGRRGLRFRPHVWLSNEWFSPIGVPGIAIPFFLAHPRLVRLERKKMLEVEGGNRRWCMQLLRHESGHAFDSAFRVHYRKRWRELFGKPSLPYPTSYQPRPYSKRFVQHLPGWYGQAHPIEDFAECFAVLITPGCSWRKRYARWPVFKKLAYVDELLREHKGQKPLVRSREMPDRLSTLKTTLAEHYEQLQSLHFGGWPSGFDDHLRRMFSDDPKFADQPAAASFLRRNRREIRRTVAKWTGEYQYTIELVLNDMIDRCRELGLRLTTDEAHARSEAPVMVAVQTMSDISTDRHSYVM